MLMNRVACFKDDRKEMNFPELLIQKKTKQDSANLIRHMFISKEY